MYETNLVQLSLCCSGTDVYSTRLKCTIHRSPPYDPLSPHSSQSHTILEPLFFGAGYWLLLPALAPGMKCHCQRLAWPWPMLMLLLLLLVVVVVVDDACWCLLVVLVVVVVVACCLEEPHGLVDGRPHGHHLRLPVHPLVDVRQRLLLRHNRPTQIRHEAVTRLSTSYLNSQSWTCAACTLTDSPPPPR